VGCEGLVESAVLTLDGVVTADASYRRGTVVVEYDPDKLTPDQIAGAINTQTYYRATGVVEDGEDAGGVAASVGVEEEGPAAGELATAVIRVEGMTDDLAAGEVMTAMGAGEAITDVSVDLSASTLTVEYDPAVTRAESLLLAIDTGTSYSATVLSTTEAEAEAGAVAKSFDYAKYAVWSIVGLFVAALTWSGVAWGRRRWAHAQAGAGRAAKRRQRPRKHRG
jgi:copper chaperone CopZ